MKMVCNNLLTTSHANIHVYFFDKSQDFHPLLLFSLKHSAKNKKSGRFHCIYKGIKMVFYFSNCALIQASRRITVLHLYESINLLYL